MLNKMFRRNILIDRMMDIQTVLAIGAGFDEIDEERGGSQDCSKGRC